MLHQLHYQFNDGCTELIAQIDIDDDLTADAHLAEIRAWIDRVKAEHPLPMGAEWLECNGNCCIPSPIIEALL